jgi:large subunit ribosomal protein L18
MDAKTKARLRRAGRGRAKIRRLGTERLTIYRTPQHIYAQVCSADGAKVLASASTLDKEVRGQIEGHSGNCAAAGVVGKMVAERAKAAGVEKVAFDRAGFKYHGRVKALADAAREGGLQF